MAEGEDEVLIEAVVDDLIAAVASAESDTGDEIASAE
jgi:hypothetical protein